MHVRQVNIEEMAVIVFDFDGVIVESTEIKETNLDRLYQDAPKDKLDQVKDYSKKSHGVARNTKLKHVEEEIFQRPFTKERLAELNLKYYDISESLVIKCVPVPGSLKFLEKHYENNHFFIASGTPHEELGRIVKVRNLSRFFEEVYGHPHLKDEVIAMAKEKYKDEPIIMVGDGRADFNAAEKENIAFVGRNIKNYKVIFPETTPAFENPYPYLEDWLLSQNS